MDRWNDMSKLVRKILLVPLYCLLRKAYSRVSPDYMRTSSEHLASTPAMLCLLVHWSRLAAGAVEGQAWASSVNNVGRAWLERLLGASEFTIDLCLDPHAV